MKDSKSPGMLTLISFTAYLYLLVKVILFKGGHVDIHILLQQFQLTLQDPGRIFHRSYNLVPFKEIKRDLHHLSLSNPFLNINLTGNVLAFIPFGVLLPNVFRNITWSVTKVLVCSLLLSLSFESIQLLLTIGTFDVDDLLLNTLGGLAGYILYTMFSGPARRKPDSEADQEGERLRSQQRLSAPEYLFLDK
ncbi:VanZ family protein [Paenibacillus sp. GCM10012306]|uniref:VanZ family protein n=1 Tax=Paenibacillus sp. GCM10012306 TaxID=3317342 RepID=UPI003607056F